MNVVPCNRQISYVKKMWFFILAFDETAMLFACIFHLLRPIKAAF